MFSFIYVYYRLNVVVMSFYSNRWNGAIILDDIYIYIQGWKINSYLRSTNKNKNDVAVCLFSQIDQSLIVDVAF